MEELRVIISGGGTGGHIFPALAIAGELKNRFPHCELLFVGALGRMEMEKVPAAGFPIVGLPVMGFPRKPGLNTFRFFVQLFQSMRKARKVVRDFRPHVVVGVGGYASGPLLRAAVSRGIPALIQEQNSYAGITNKLLGKKANRICVAYEGMERFFPREKLVFTGNPVRQNLLDRAAEKGEALAFFSISSGRKVMLIVGGSLGARTLNNAVLQNLEQIRQSELEIIWQTGSLYFEEMKQKTEGILPPNLHLHQFLNRMDLAYAAADVVVSRAGAGTISELCLVGKPVVLVPSPNVAEDHQTKNAQALVDKQAAVLVRDHEIGEKLMSEIASLAADEARMTALSENIRKLARPEATRRIVDEVLKLIHR